MKKYKLIKYLCILLFASYINSASAQTGLNFQGVARTSNNVIIASQDISLKLSILQGSATGIPEYGTRHDKESVLRWFKRVNTILPDLKFEMTDIQVKGGPANTLVIARWTATCHLLNGEPYENKGVHFITIKWGKAVKFDVYENTKVVSHGLDVQFEAGIKEAKAPKIVS